MEFWLRSTTNKFIVGVGLQVADGAFVVVFAVMNQLPLKQRLTLRCLERKKKQSKHAISILNKNQQ